MRLTGIRIVVADDNPELLFTLQSVLENEGAEVHALPDGEQALEAVRELIPDLVILDVVMPKKDGLAATESIKSDPELRYIPVVLLSSKDELDDISRGIERGADDYVRKPFKQDELIDRLIAALRTGELYQELKRARGTSDGAAPSSASQLMVGSSPAIDEVCAKIEQFKSSAAPLLILGESGSGKEVVARAVHQLGDRAKHPFIAQNCSAIQESLLESELFGHVRGAFTGAVRDRKGLFETADGGVLFLDEIGELAAGLQAKLLRVLQDGTFSPVGSSESKKVDVRVITATHRDLDAMVEQGTFREDLLYRLKVLTIEVPPLRERKSDIPELIDWFLQRSCSKNGRSIKKLSEESLDFMKRYDWPGNIRELENEIERLVVVSGDAARIGVGLLPPHVLGAGEGESPVTEAAEEHSNLKDAISALERKMIADALESAEGNKSEAARILGVSRSNLISKVKAYDLE